MTPSVQFADGRRVTRWNRESIIEKIAEWHARHGEPPVSADWNPSLARWRAQEWRAERYYAGSWPSTNAVKRAFDGSFDAAVRAAGFEPARPGPRRRALSARPAVPEGEPPPFTARMLQIAYRLVNGATDREIARALDVSERTVSAEVREMSRRLGARSRAHAISLISGVVG